MKKYIFTIVVGVLLFSGCDGEIKSKITNKIDSIKQKKSSKENTKIKEIKNKSNLEIKKIDKQLIKNQKSLDSSRKDQVRKQLKAEKEGKVNVLAGQRENMWE